MAVRPMTDEELDREGWEGLKLGCAVLDSGAIIYPSDRDGEAPGLGFAQFGGELWTISADGEHQVKPEPEGPRMSTIVRVRRATLEKAEAVLLWLTLGFIVGAAALGAILATIDENHDFRVPMVGVLIVGWLGAAAACWVLRELVRSAQTVLRN